MQSIIDKLLCSEEPSVIWKVRHNVLGEDPASLRPLQEEIRGSPRTRTLLSACMHNSQPNFGAYQKWCGAHWVLSLLPDLGYPPGDPSLLPLREHEFAYVLGEQRLESLRRRNRHLPAERFRICASQEGNGLYALVALGLEDDERIHELAERLIQYQWPDGGWNCDIKPGAHTSSFHETITPLRGLVHYARRFKHPAAQAAVTRAAGVFLSRNLHRRLADGLPISPEFTRLHYPPYWHYDILFGLKVMAEAGLINDPRCQPALDILESHRLPDGGFPAHAAYYRVTERPISGRSPLGWGAANGKTMNEFVTADVLAVLAAAGRLQ